MCNTTHSKGFSLIELMIVIAIIGILAAIAVPSYQSYVMKARMGELLTVMQAGQLRISEYIQTTGEADCSDLHSFYDIHGNSSIVVSSASDAADEIDGFDGSTCGFGVLGDDALFGGTEPDLIYAATINPDGSMNWTCYFISGDAAIMPQGCNDET